MRYGIQSIPAMILFKDGEPAAAAVGAQPKGALERRSGSSRRHSLVRGRRFAVARGTVPAPAGSRSSSCVSRKARNAACFAR